MSALMKIGLDIVPASRVETARAEWALARTAAGARLAVLVGVDARHLLEDFKGETSTPQGRVLLLAPLVPHNAAALRRHLPWLTPRPLGLQTSAGMGDRLGLATVGHVRAMQAAGPGIAPIYAQQSIREMTRTNRTPQQVMDDATWGAFAAGWHGMVGADADHLKTPADIDSCLAAGFSFFTIDPSAHVDSAADTDTPAALREKFAALPWGDLEDSAADLRGRYAGRTFAIEEHRVAVDEEALLRAAVKYGRAVAHVRSMYAHLVSRVRGQALRSRGVGRRDRHAHHARRAPVRRERDEAPRHPVGEPGPAVRRAVREGRRLHRRPRRLRARSSRCTPRLPATPGPTSSACTRAPTSSASTASPRTWRAAWCT